MNEKERERRMEEDRLRRVREAVVLKPRSPGASTAAVAKPMDPDIMEAHAQVVLDHVAGMDPLWAERIRITREEKGYTALQILSAWVGHVLDTGSHMLHPPHPYFETGFKAAGARATCTECGRDFAAAFAGQRACSDACWEKTCEGRSAVAYDKHVDQQLAEDKERDADRMTD